MFLQHDDDRLKWWSRTGSNRRPPACKAGALPAELRPLKQYNAFETLKIQDHLKLLFSQNCYALLPFLETFFYLISQDHLNLP